MPLVKIGDELNEILELHKTRIKGTYINKKMFVDSAIRDKLRKMGIAAGQDEIIGHLERLERNKSRHLNQASVKKTLARHRMRVKRNQRSLNELEV